MSGQLAPPDGRDPSSIGGLLDRFRAISPSLVEPWATTANYSVDLPDDFFVSDEAAEFLAERGRPSWSLVERTSVQTKTIRGIHSLQMAGYEQEGTLGLPLFREPRATSPLVCFDEDATIFVPYPTLRSALDAYCQMVEMVSDYEESLTDFGSTALERAWFTGLGHPGLGADPDRVRPSRDSFEYGLGVPDEALDRVVDFARACVAADSHLVSGVEPPAFLGVQQRSFATELSPAWQAALLDD